VTKQSQGEKQDCFATLAMTLSVVGLQNLGVRFCKALKMKSENLEPYVSESVIDAVGKDDSQTIRKTAEVCMATILFSICMGLPSSPMSGRLLLPGLTFGISSLNRSL